MIDGLHFVSRKRAGKPVLHYVYAFRGGPRIHRKEGGTRPKVTAEIIEAYNQAMADRIRPKKGTLKELSTMWRRSPDWGLLAETTKKIWGPRLTAIEERWGALPLEIFDDKRMRADIMEWRDGMSGTPRTADYFMTIMCSLLGFGVDRFMLERNVAEKIPHLYKGGNRAGIIWTPREREVLNSGLDQAVNDAFELACRSGLRRGDLVKIPIEAVGEYAIVWRTRKSGKEVVVTVPMISALREHIAILLTRQRKPGVGTLLVNSRGQSWSPGGLTCSFNAGRDELGLGKHFDPSFEKEITKHFHDSRGTYVTELCLAGLTDEQIGGITGWAIKNIAAIRRVYVDQARTVVAIGERLSKGQL